MLALFGISWLAAALMGLTAVGAISAFSKPKIETPPPPIPTAVPTIGAESQDVMKRKLHKRVSGRKRTIVTGDLTPEQVGKRTLLG